VLVFPHLNRRLAGMLVAILFAAPWPASAQSKSDDGFISLFNGKNLSGWVVVGSPKAWSVRHGIIHCDSALGGRWLRSEKQYGDFVLNVDWRVSKTSSSSVYLRAPAKGRPYLIGYGVQISTVRDDDEHCTGALYGFVKVDQRPDESPDKWHRFEIRCQGTRISVVANGVQCIDYDQRTSERTKNKALRGYIGLEDCGLAKGRYVEFRNIRIKPLD
jgi:Domain of Unknown Function (DUF1080)